MVALEAMAGGTPILASRIGSLAEIVQHERTGYLIDPQDVEAWHYHLSSILNDPGRAAQMGLAARQQFLECHSEEVGLRSLIAIYETVLARAAKQVRTIG